MNTKQRKRRKSKTSLAYREECRKPMDKIMPVPVKEGFSPDGVSQTSAHAAKTSVSEADDGQSKEGARRMGICKRCQNWMTVLIYKRTVCQFAESFVEGGSIHYAFDEAMTVETEPKGEESEFCCPTCGMTLASNEEGAVAILTAFPMTEETMS